MKTVCSIALTLSLLFSASAFAQGQGVAAKGGVTISSSSTFADKTLVAGDTICFDLVARDDLGNIIRSWDQVGTPITITLFNSSANTDTSVQSWNADPDGYTWARFLFNGVELTKVSANEWTIPQTEFVNGTINVCLINTSADTSVYFVVTPTVASLNQTSETITFTAGTTTNFLVELTSSVPGQYQVYQYRKYEIIVSPRDQYMNITNEEIKADFSARFPGEFVNSQPGFSDIFSGSVFVKGPTNYFLASTIIRELPNDQLQSIRCDGANDPTIIGISNEYEILNHAPVPFTLLTPDDHTIWHLDTNSYRRTCTWEQPSPADPYTNILISPFTGEIGSDVVTYEWVVMDSMSLTHAQRLASNSNGELPSFTATNLQYSGIGSAVAGYDFDTLNVVWFVNATDGLSTTKSTPPNNDPQGRPGYYMTWINEITGVEALPEAPTSVALYQNYPNPFNPSTNIRFETMQQGNVTLKVYDIIGNEIATLVDEELNPGVYSATFDAAKLPTGVYIYRLNASGKTFTRRMVLSK